MNNSTAHKWIICRICLKGSAEEMRKIFSVNADEEDLVRKITECSGIHLDDCYKLPDKICSKCLTMLRIAHKFRTLCQNSQQQLLNLLQLPEPAGKDDINLKSIQTKEEAVDVAVIAVKYEVESFQEEMSSDGMRYIIESEGSDDVCMKHGCEIRILECSDVEEEFIERGDSGHHDIEYLQDETDEIVAVDDDNTELFRSHGLNNAEYGNNESLVFENCVDRLSSDHESSTEKEIAKTRKRKNGDALKPAKKARKLKSSHRDFLDSRVDDDSSKNYICFHCGNIYAERAKLTLHLKIHAKNKPHECEICHKRFSQTPQLSRHMNSHTGFRPFKCKFCPSSFADPSTRIKHERIHTNLRPYKCEACGKAFSYSNVLKVHMMTHTGERPFSCKFCSKKFTQLHHKKAHERTHNCQPVLKQEFEDVEQFNYD